MGCFARLSCYLLYRMASLFPNPLIPMIPGKREIQIFKKNYPYISQMGTYPPCSPETKLKYNIPS